MDEREETPEDFLLRAFGRSPKPEETEAPAEQPAEDSTVPRFQMAPWDEALIRLLHPPTKQDE